MAQSSEIKLNKRFDQNIEITGTIKIGVREQTTAGDYVSDKITLVPPYHTGGPFNIRTRDDAGSAFISVAYDDTEVLTIKHDGTLNSTSNITINGNSVLTSIPSEYLTQTEGDDRYLGLSAKAANSNLLDGIDSGSFLRSDANDNYNSYTTSYYTRYNVKDGSFIASAGDNSRFPLQIYAQNGTDAAIAFHIGSDYAGYFGLDTTNNDLFWGGWSVGSTTKHRIWHSGNHGSGSGLNADTIDGYHASSLWRSDGGTWNPSANIYLNQTANGQEWSFDISRNGYTGGYWHVWDSSLSTMLKVDPNNGKVYAPYNFVGNLEGTATNAGTLDGIDSSSFVRSDADDTITGDILINTGATQNGIRFRTTSGDFVGRYSNYVSLYNQISGGEIRMYDTDYIILDSPDVRVAGGHQVIHGGNIGSQSVAYAQNANNLDGLNSTAYMRDDGWNTSPGQDADTQTGMRSDFSYSNNAPHTGDLIRFGSGNYSLQLSSQYSGSGQGFSFRTRNGDNATWNPWYQLIHAGNISSQSVSYATTSGTANSVSWGNVSSKPAGWLNTTNLISNSNPNATAFPSGFYEHSDGANTPTGTWFNYINVRHSNVGNGHGYQLGMSYYDNNLWFRSYRGGLSPTFEPWETAIASGSSNQTKNGFLQSNNSLRAPIFYDSDDTTRYVNPNGQTVLNSGAGYETLIVTGEYPQITVRRTSIPDASIHYDAGYAKKWNVGPGAGGAEEDEFGFAIYSAPRGTHYGTPMRINAETQNVMIGDADHPSFKLDVRGQIRATSDIRGTLFYDENNTNYYLNPDADLSLKVYGEICNSGVYEGNMQPGALNIGGVSRNYNFADGSWAGDVRAGIMANCLNEWEFVVHDSGTSVESVFLYQNSNGSITMGRDIGWGTTPIIAANSFRAPIFYDSNNTGYYVDAASTTNLNTVLMNAQTWRGNITWNSGVNINVSGESSFDILGSGGIWQVWTAANSQPSIYVTYSGQTEIGKAGTRGLKVWGTMTATADVVAYSDIRTKENIKPIENALDKVKEIQGVEFNKIGDTNKSIGVIAQEIEKVLPEVVREQNDGMKAVAYGNITAILIEAVKELSNKVEDLENQLKQKS